MDTAPVSDLARLSRDLKGLNAKPLWERTARMGPGSPAVPTIWRYRDMRPHLLRAIDLITASEAERRVFMLENPGLPGTGYITNSLYCGLQVIKPGEIAPATPRTHCGSSSKAKGHTRPSRASALPCIPVISSSRRAGPGMTTATLAQRR